MKFTQTKLTCQVKAEPYKSHVSYAEKGGNHILEIITLKFTPLNNMIWKGHDVHFARMNFPTEKEQ